MRIVYNYDSQKLFIRPNTYNYVLLNSDVISYLGLSF